MSVDKGFHLQLDALLEHMNVMGTLAQDPLYGLKQRKAASLLADSSERSLILHFPCQGYPWQISWTLQGHQTEKICLWWDNFTLGRVLTLPPNLKVHSSSTLLRFSNCDNHEYISSKVLMPETAGLTYFYMRKTKNNQYQIIQTL